MLKNKLKKIITTVLLSAMILSNGGQVVGATTTDAIDVVARASQTTKPDTTPSTTVKDGQYSVDNAVEYIPENESSNVETGSTMARNALEQKTAISVENEKVTMTLTFNKDLYWAMNDIKVSLDGQDLNGISDTTNRTITFDVPSVDSKVKVDMNISVMGKNVSFYVTNDTSGLPVVDEEDDNTNGEEVEAPVVLEDGNYKATNITRYITDSIHGNQSARAALETETSLEVKNGKVYMTLTFTDMFKMLEDITVSLDGQTLDSNINNDKKTITFEVSAANTEVLMGMNIAGMNHKVEFFVKNDKNTIVKVEDNNEGITPETPELPETPDDNTDNEGSNNETVVGTKVYTIKNEVSHETEIGLNMARKVLSETSKVEEVNGKYYVTLTLTEFGSKMMNNHEVYVNGNKVSPTKLVNGNIISLRFEAVSLKDSYKVSGYVSAMGKNVDFGVKLLEDTLTLVTDSSTDGTTDDATEGNTSGNTDGENNNDTSDKKEEEQVLKGKLYSIQNNVTHESETGRAMARKYLNSTSKVEEIEGTYYVTLTFTGASFMQNHEIYVNGTKVSARKSTSGDTTTIRFAVPNLDAKIIVKTYVVPMARNVEFGVVLLKDTLTFIKEYTVDKLPNTGAPIASGAVAGLGLVLTAAGTVLAKKRR